MRFAFALPLLAVFAQPAMATPAEDFEMAIAAVEARLAKAERGGQLTPARRDPAVAADFATIRTSMEQYGSTDFPIRFPESINTVCGRLQQALGVYIKDPELLKYQDEMTVLMVGGTSCMARQMPLFASFWDALSERERQDGRASGITQMRGGVELVLVNIVALSVAADISAANQRALGAAAADWGGQLGTIFSLNERRALLKKIETTTPGWARKFPEFSTRLRAGLNDPACNTICQTV
jgi:hypothetical protein